MFFWIPNVLVSIWIPAIGSGHYSGALLSVAGQGSIMIHTGNSDGVYTIYIAIVCTTVSPYASITSRKRVDGTQATTTLDLNKVLSINVCRTSKKSAVTDHKSTCIYSLYDKLNVTLHLSIQTKKTIVENTKTIAFEICWSEFIGCIVKPKNAHK